MARESFVFLVAGIMIFFLGSVSSAVVPDKINYQGKLTTASGGCLNDTVQMTFSTYPDTLGSPANWTETQTEVIVKEGIFNVLLGSVVSIPDTIFDGSTKYLGVQVESDPEMRPLKPMVSVAYAMKAGSGGDCHDCDTVFVNVAGPDSVVGTTGTAFLGKVLSSSGSRSIGVEGYAENTSSSLSANAYGGYFETSYLGNGDHFGICAKALSFSSSSSAAGILAIATNDSDGDAIGGIFTADGYGTGYRKGLQAFGMCTHEVGGPTIGIEAISNSPSFAYGGYFAASDNMNQAPAYGVYASADGSPAYAVYGWADGGVGDSYGGYFATGAGTGHGYGVYAESYSHAGVFNTATYGYASNHGNGDCWAGYFIADDEGDGTDSHTGVRGHGIGSAGNPNYGVWGYAENTSTGGARGGYFVASSSGTGTHYGVYGSEAAGGGGAAVYASGDFAGSGAKYAVVRTDKGHRLLSCMESPEVWFEDFGEGRLVNGKAHIELDPLFLETVTINAQHPMKVFVQLEGDCNGVFVTKGTTGFDVNELKSGTSNIVFSYRVVAKRKGYEDERLRETDVGYDDATLYPELQAEIDKAYQEEKQQQQLQREKRKREKEQRREEQKKMEEERTRMGIK